MSKFGDESDTYSCHLKAETGAAWLVSDGDDSDAVEAWLPKSQCKMVTQNPEMGSVVEIEVPNWLADQKGLLG